MKVIDLDKMDNENVPGKEEQHATLRAIAIEQSERNLMSGDAEKIKVTPIMTENVLPKQKGSEIPSGKNHDEFFLYNLELLKVTGFQLS